MKSKSYSKINLMSLVALALVFSACNEDVQLEEGPLSKRGRMQAERGREENLQQEKRLNEGDSRNDRQDKQISKNTALTLEEAQKQEYERLMLQFCDDLVDRHEAEGFVSTRQAPRISIAEISYGNKPRQKVILFQGSYINGELIEKAIHENSTNIRDFDPSDRGILLVGRKNKKPGLVDVPIVFSADWIDLSDEVRLRTKGRDLIFIGPRISLNTQITTTPDSSPTNQAGKNGGNLEIHSPCFELGEFAEIDLSGGEPGDFEYRSPENPKALNQAIALAKSGLKIRWEDRSSRPQMKYPGGGLTKARAKEIWKQAQAKISAELGSRIANNPPWKGDDHGLNWGIYSQERQRQILSTAELEVVIPSIQINAQMQSGYPGVFRLNTFVYALPDTLKIEELLSTINASQNSEFRSRSLTAPQFAPTQRRVKIELKTKSVLQIRAAREGFSVTGTRETLTSKNTLTQVFHHLWNETRKNKESLPIRYSVALFGGLTRSLSISAQVPQPNGLVVKDEKRLSGFSLPEEQGLWSGQTLLEAASLRAQAIENTDVSKAY